MKETIIYFYISISNLLVEVPRFKVHFRNNCISYTKHVRVYASTITGRKILERFERLIALC